MTSIDIRPFMARTAAANIFVQCLPLVLADLVRRAHRGGFLQFQGLGSAAALAPGLAEDDVRVVVSSAWIDLANEPGLLRLPNSRGRYVSATLLDSAGEPFASYGSRTGDDCGMDLALVGPGWVGELPSGVKAKRAPSDSIWVVSRLRAHSPLDQAEALALANRLCVATLRRRPDPPWSGAASPEPRDLPSLRQLQDLAPQAYFDRLDAVLARAPPSLQPTVVKRVNALRRELGGPPPSAQWTPEFVQALASGLEEGLTAVRAAAQTQPAGDAPDWRNWSTGAPGPHMNALTRAARAYVALGAPLTEDQLILDCSHDESGRPLTGGYAYRLRFERGALPPVDGFWRLTTRPPAGGARKGGLGSRSDLALNPDGSLDLYLQHAPPEVDRLSNWLPTPAGVWALELRLYSPRPAALGGAWKMPALSRLEPTSTFNRSEWREPIAYRLPPRTTFGRRSRVGR